MCDQIQHDWWPKRPVTELVLYLHYIYIAKTRGPASFINPRLWQGLNDNYLSFVCAASFRDSTPLSLIHVHKRYVCHHVLATLLRFHGHAYVFLSSILKTKMMKFCVHRTSVLVPTKSSFIYKIVSCVIPLLLLIVIYQWIVSYST